MSEFKVQFEIFEGPLDLLLYLVKKEEVDIYEVNLTKLATEFINYVDLMRQLDLDIAGEFLVMAATLMYIKSRELLPKDLQVETEGEDDGEDPRWELIRQLVEYKKFKDAAAKLQELEHRQEGIFPRLPPKLEFERDQTINKAEASIFDLVNAVTNILKRFSEKEDLREIFEDKWSVSEKIELLRRRIGESPRLKFSEMFADATSRTEVVVTFLAMLELIRMKILVALQSEDFGDIELGRGPQAAPAPTLNPVGTESSAWALDAASTETA